MRRFFQFFDEDNNLSEEKNWEKIPKENGKNKCKILQKCPISYRKSPADFSDYRFLVEAYFLLELVNPNAEVFLRHSEAVVSRLNRYFRLRQLLFLFVPKIGLLFAQKGVKVCRLKARKNCVEIACLKAVNNVLQSV